MFGHPGSDRVAGTPSIQHEEKKDDAGEGRQEQLREPPRPPPGGRAGRNPLGDHTMTKPLHCGGGISTFRPMVTHEA